MIQILFLIIIIFIIFSHFSENKIEIIRINNTNSIDNINNINNINNIKRKYNNTDEGFVNDFKINKSLQSNNNIWSKIINNKYYIKIKPLTLEDYTNWKDYIDNSNIVDDIYFDPNIGELIIISNDEDIAIAVAYSIINNYNGNTNFEDSIDSLNNNLKMIKNNDELKNKLIINIFNNLNPMKNNVGNFTKSRKKETFSNIKSEQSNIKSEQSNIRSDQSHTKSGQSNIRSDQAHARLEQSNTNTGQINARLESSMNNYEQPNINSRYEIKNNNYEKQNNDIDAYNDDLDILDNINYSYISN